MKASRKGTRLNDPHYFKQPLPHLRDHMTVMCVLSKISGIQDKIQVSETHDAILRGELISSTEKNGRKIKCSPDREDLVKRRGNRGPVTGENLKEDRLTIKIGLEKRLEVETGHIRGGDERLSRIIRPRNVSVGSSCPFSVTDDGEHRRYLRPSSLRPPRPSTLRRDSSGHCGVMGFAQHWESMINTGPGGLPPVKEESRSSKSPEEVNTGCDQPVFKPRKSTARKNRTIPEESCAFGDKKDQVATKNERKERHADSNCRLDSKPQSKERRLARSWLQSSRMEPEPERTTPTVSRLRRMALGLLGMFGLTDKVRERENTPTMRVKILYRRTSSRERKVRNYRDGNRTGEENCGDCDEGKR